jgi:hypothetical protein
MSDPSPARQPHLRLTIASMLGTLPDRTIEGDKAAVPMRTHRTIAFA